MSVDPHKRQKKLQRLKAKRQEKRHHHAREQSAGLAERLTAAARYPVLSAWVAEDLWTQGMGQAVLSRALPDGSVAFAVFLVDRYCLGVKDAFGSILSRAEYESRFEQKSRSQFAVRDVSPATVRKLVEGAVAYAASLGLAPHADYHKAKHIFGSIAPAESTEEFEFGKDGKPLFIAGPNDTPARCRQILAILTHSCGPDGVDYALPDSEDIDRILPESLRQKPARLIGPDGMGGYLDLPVDFDAEETARERRDQP